MLKQYRMILTITKEYYFLLHFTDKRKEKSRTFIALACCTKSLVSHNIKHSKTSGKDSRCSEKILVKQKFIIVSLTSTCDFFFLHHGHYHSFAGCRCYEHSIYVFTYSFPIFSLNAKSYYTQNYQLVCLLLS